MEDKTMRNTKNSLIKWVLGAALLFAGVQDALAFCKGTAYIKPPSAWTNVYVSGQNGTPTQAKFNAVNGLYVIDLSTVKGIDNSSTEFGVGDKPKPNQATNDTLHVLTALGVKADLYDANAMQNNHPFSCPGEGNRTFVIVDDKGVVKQTSNPPGAKYFFVMIPPDMKEWMSAVPMISMDGGKTGKAMTADAERCGWYYYEFFDDAPTDNVVMFRDDDTEGVDMIGALGDAEPNKSAPSPLPLASIFSVADSLFFIAATDEWNGTEDDGMRYTSEEVDGLIGVCEYTMAAVIYDTDPSLHPLFSCYSSDDVTDETECQKGAQGVSLATALTAINNCVGVTQNLVEQFLDPSLPQAMRKPKLSSEGKKCFIEEKFFNQMFNYTPGVNEKSCYDMPFSKAADGKWEFDSDFYKSPGTNVAGGFYPAENNTDAIILAADPNQIPVPAARTKHAAEGAVFYGPDLRKIDPSQGMPKIDLLCKGPGWTGGYNCEKKFADGDGTDAFVHDIPGLEDACVFGWSCPNDAPIGWMFYEEDRGKGTEKPIGVLERENVIPQKNNKQGSARWGSNVTDGAGRNQHYCFESHAKFTYKPGLKFNFRGDDDIWVFIDNKLAVDLGGTHLAAPGFVDLDSFVGLSGGFKVGNEYDIDIFFCDRRTTMSNVRIKTNMYIRQTTDIEKKQIPNPANPTAKTYSMKYTKTGASTCAAAMSGSGDDKIVCEGSDIVSVCQADIKFYLQMGGRFNAETAELLDDTNLNCSGGICYGGINLTNPTSPSVDLEAAKKKMRPGRWNLYIVIDGKPQVIERIVVSGGLDVLRGNALALDSNGNKILGLGYQFTSSVMGCGNAPNPDCIVPLYITALSSTEAGELFVIPSDAIGAKYTLVSSSADVNFGVLNNGTWSDIDISSQRTIGPSGVDTIYAWVPRSAITDPNGTEVRFRVASRTEDAKINFFLPKLVFVDTLFKEFDPTINDSIWRYNEMVLGDTMIDGKYEERLTGMDYNFFLIAVNPNNPEEFQQKKTCHTCNLDLFKGPESSPKVDVADEENLTIVNGGVIFQAHSLAKYPVGGDPAVLSIIGDNDVMKAYYTPMYFVDPPCPIPLFVDVFDVEGGAPALPLDNIPDAYKDPSNIYLDGIADMFDVYYDRKIPVDSLPLAICMTWDSTSATEIIPAKEGVAKDEKQKILCNAWIKRTPGVVDTSEMKVTNCNQSMSDLEGNTIVDASGKPVTYCDRRIRISGVALSKKPKTTGPGMVYSFSEYVDSKGNLVKQGFSPTQGEAAVIDRVAPVPLSARVLTIKDGKGQPTNTDRMTVVMSESVQNMPDATNAQKTNPFKFFLASALTISEPERFRDVPSAAPIVSKDTIVVTYATKDASGNENITPHRGDFLRLSGSIADKESVVWTDGVDIDVIKGSKEIRDSMRAAVPGDIFLDESYYWNSPTGLSDGAKRLSSPWVEITGDAEYGIWSNSFAYTANAAANINDNPQTDAAMFILPYEKFVTDSAIYATHHYVPGFFIKADLNSAWQTARDKSKNKEVNINKVTMNYNVTVYTNLGNHVATLSGKVHCDDSKNYTSHGRYFFSDDGSKTCADAVASRNYFIGWNMRSDEGREVGTGAYIAKIEIVLNADGKRTSIETIHNKKDGDKKSYIVWGVKRSDREYVPPTK